MPLRPPSPRWNCAKKCRAHAQNRRAPLLPPRGPSMMCTRSGCAKWILAWSPPAGIGLPAVSAAHGCPVQTLSTRRPGAAHFACVILSKSLGQCQPERCTETLSGRGPDTAAAAQELPGRWHPYAQYTQARCGTACTPEPEHASGGSRDRPLAEVSKPLFLGAAGRDWALSRLPVLTAAAMLRLRAFA